MPPWTSHPATITPVPSTFSKLQAQAVPPDSLHGTVLCIEDQPVNMDQVEALIGEFPHVRLLKAATGREGLRLARAERPELVLLDMHLPDIGGLSVVRELSEEIAEKRMKVVLLTGDHMSIDVVKAMSLGAHDYWLKPLTREHLRAGLVTALSA